MAQAPWTIAMGEGNLAVRVKEKRSFMLMEASSISHAVSCAVRMDVYCWGVARVSTVAPALNGATPARRFIQYMLVASQSVL